MKALKTTSLVLLLLLISVYVLLFTPLNTLTIVPIIKDKISKATKIEDIQINHFNLSLSSLEILVLVQNQMIKINSSFGILAKTLDTSYEVDIKDLSTFNKVSNQKLQGTFYTVGTLKGTFDDLNLVGFAKLANGEIDYKLKIDRNNIRDIILDINSIDLPTLLTMVNQPQYINGKLSANTTISSINLEDVQFKANVKAGKFNVAVFQENLALTIPKSKFSLDTNINLQNKIGDFKFDFSSNLIRLWTKGNINLNTLNTNSKYKVLINNLAMLEPIIGIKSKGAIQTNGTIKGDKKDMTIVGKSNLAKGNTTYNINLKNMAINSIKGNIKDTKIDELLSMVNQPKYAKAKLNMNFDIKLLPTLKGSINTAISKGTFNQYFIKKDFDIKLPKYANFNLKTNTTLDKNIIKTNTLLNSFAAKLQTAKTIFDTDTSTLTTDYTLTIPSLKKLYFITNQKMQGNIRVTGDVKFDKSLTANFNSKKFNGDIEGTLKDNNLTVSMKNIESLQLLDMMYYPKVFTSSIDVDLKYNLTTKQGLSQVNTNNGKFLPNKLSNTINQYIKKDLTTEVYKVAILDTKIDNQKLHNHLYMKSENSKIDSSRMLIDLEKSHIDSAFNIDYYSYTLGVEAKGNLSNPKVKIDTGNLIKAKAKEKVQSYIQDKFGDKVDDKIKKKLGGLLNGLFK